MDRLGIITSLSISAALLSACCDERSCGAHDVSETVSDIASATVVDCGVLNDSSRSAVVSCVDDAQRVDHSVRYTMLGSPWEYTHVQNPDGALFVIQYYAEESVEWFQCAMPTTRDGLPYCDEFAERSLSAVTSCEHRGCTAVASH
jgi:hypothetical protein